MALYRDTVVSLGATSHWTLGEASGVFVDSIGGHDGTATGTPTRDVANATLATDDGGVSFATTSDYITVADHADLDVGNTNYSFAFFFSRSTNTGAIEIMFNKGANAFSVGIFDSGGPADKLMLGSVGNAVLAYGSTSIPADGSIHHGVITRTNGTTVGMYIDGVAETVTIADSVTTTADNTSVLEIGREGAGNRWTGMLDELSIFKGVVLTSGQVTTLYASRTETTGGTAASSFSFATSATASEDIPGTAASTFSFATASDGVADASGTCGVAFSFSSASQGSIWEVHTGSGGSTFGFSVAMAGDVGPAFGGSALDPHPLSLPRYPWYARGLRRHL